MKINRIPPSNVINKYIHSRENIQVDSKPAQATDKVELTKESKTFSAALKQAKESVATRTPQETKRIEEVTRQVRDGSYNVKGEDVAAKILGLD